MAKRRYNLIIPIVFLLLSIGLFIETYGLNTTPVLSAMGNHVSYASAKIVNDLEVLSFFREIETVSEGDRVTFATTIKNTGTAPGKFVFNYYAEFMGPDVSSEFARVKYPNALGDEVIEMTSELAVGETLTASYIVTIPEGIYSYMQENGFTQLTVNVEVRDESNIEIFDTSEWIVKISEPGRPKAEITGIELIIAGAQTLGLLGGLALMGVII